MEAMSVATASYYPSVTADVVSGSQWLPPSLSNTLRLTPTGSPFPSPTPETSQVSESQETTLRIEVPEFDFCFAMALTDIQTNNDYSSVIVEALIDPGVSVALTLSNQVADDAGNLQIKEVSLNFDVMEHRPRARFLIASLYAAFTLAGTVKIVIPGMGINVGANFSMPLPKISEFLQGRQTYYGLMAIERATGLRFAVPEHISGDDMNAISFSYHAIVERTFDWPAKFITLPMPADEDSVAWLQSLPRTEPGGSVYRLQFGPEPTSRAIFGQTVPLGHETIFIDDGVFQNLEEVRRGLAKRDGQIVPVGLRSLSGMGRYHFPDAPRLPESPWDEKIEACIKLEDQLNDRLGDRYNDLAASTLDGLTQEEIKAITERPVLGEDAYLIQD